MPLDTLASTTDFQARYSLPAVPARLEVALKSVSAAIRDAANCPISRVTATVRVTPDETRLPLLGPILEVDSVTVDGTTFTGYHDDDYGLTSRRGWGRRDSRVLVTYTFGYDPVPEDIVDLTCNLAKAHLDHLADGGGSTAGLTQVRLDDASESYSDEAAGQVSPAFLPQATREWLAHRFGGGVTIVSTR